MVFIGKQQFMVLLYHNFTVKNKMLYRTDFPEEYTYLEGMAYLDMFEKDGYIYIFPFYANMILKVDIEKKEITQAFAL